LAALADDPSFGQFTNVIDWVLNEAAAAQRRQCRSVTRAVVSDQPGGAHAEILKTMTVDDASGRFRNPCEAVF
jgi:hypothetical protein